MRSCEVQRQNGVLVLFCFVFFFKFIPFSQAKLRDSWLYSLPFPHFNILLFVLEPLHPFLLQYDLTNKYFSTPIFSYFNLNFLCSISALLFLLSNTSCFFIIII